MRENSVLHTFFHCRLCVFSVFIETKKKESLPNNYFFKTIGSKNMNIGIMVSSIYYKCSNTEFFIYKSKFKRLALKKILLNSKQDRNYRT